MSSRRRKATSRRSAVTSMSRTAAKITSAPSAATGNLAMSPCPNASTASSTAAAVTEYSWVRLPAAWPSAVRLALLLTGKPRTSETAMLDAPSASSS